MIRYFLLSCLLLSCTKSQRIDRLNFSIDSAITDEEYSDLQLSIGEDTTPSTYKGKVKKIGGFSRKFPKRSFIIHLDSPISIAQLPARNDWILNASYIDKTFIRHRFSFDLFRSMSPRNLAPRCRYIEVGINGNYEGLFVLMEFIDIEYLNALHDASSALLCIDCPVFRNDFVLNDTINYSLELTGGLSGIKNRALFKEFFNFIKFSSDADFEAKLNKWIDLEEFIDWHLLLLLTNNSDGILKNFGLYKADSLSPFRIALWDYDHSFGRDGDYEINMLERNVDIKRSILFRRLMEHPSLNYTLLIMNRYSELRSKGGWKTDLLIDKVDLLTEEIKEDVTHNFYKWPLDGPGYHDKNQYDQEVDILKSFIRLNVQRLDVMILEERMSGF